MTDYTTRSAEEAKTHKLIDERTMEWTPTGACLAQVWKACYIKAMTVEQVNAVAIALCSLQQGADFQAELTKWARAKILRSYVKQGRKLYEVNY